MIHFRPSPLWRAMLALLGAISITSCGHRDASRKEGGLGLWLGDWCLTTNIEYSDPRIIQLEVSDGPSGDLKLRVEMDGQLQKELLLKQGDRRAVISVDRWPEKPNLKFDLRPADGKGNGGSGSIGFRWTAKS